MLKSDLEVTDKKIQILTLGRFQIKQGDLIVSESSRRSKRMWEIFMFFISHRRQTFQPDTMLEKIWPDHDSADPGLVMRALIFRLRQTLKSDHDSLSLDKNIVFSHGSYHWQEITPYWLDVDELEKLAAEANELFAENPEEAALLYWKAINLYNGIYLSETTYNEWVEPRRSYYSDIYLESVLHLADLLAIKKDHAEIIKLCEQAATLCYFEEKIHVKLIEALLATGANNRARAHYNEVTSAFYNEMGIKPSARLKNLYRLAGSESGSFELDLGIIQEGLKEKDSTKGAFYCDPELFRYFYNIDRLRFERSGQSILLVLLTLTAPDYSLPEKNTLHSVMNNLQVVAIESLRKGDLVTRWSDAQFLLLLPGLNREQAEKVAERIKNAYHKKYNLQGLVLHHKTESLMPLEGDSHFS